MSEIMKKVGWLSKILTGGNWHPEVWWKIWANLLFIPLPGKAAVMFATPVVTVTRGDSPIIYGRENVKVWMRSTLFASDT